MIKIGCHAPNFCPWFPYFYKMAMCDKFVILKYVQFRKGGYENRYTLANGKVITSPVTHGLDMIKIKRYHTGESLFDTNMCWINAIKKTLGINTTLVFEHETDLSGTERLIYLVNHHGGDTYVTNPDAKNKYLDEKLMHDKGIKIEYCKVPKDLQIHVFDAFEKWGIDGTIKQLKRALK